MSGIEVLKSWVAAKPALGNDFGRDKDLCCPWLVQGTEILLGSSDRDVWEAIKHESNQIRAQFLDLYTDAIYDALKTEANGPLGAEALVYAAAEMFPGLTPSREQVADEDRYPIVEKRGLELAQGLFFSKIMRHDRVAASLMQDSRRPLQRSLKLLESFKKTGYADLGKARVTKKDGLGILEISNPDYLNAEDDPTLEAMEICADLILLDPEIRMGVLRGSEATHPKYQGRRVFCSGVNLTHIFNGKLSYMFFFGRELGLMNKLYRGLYHEDAETYGNDDIEKPWVAAVEAHAVGGGCQLLLVMDYVLIEDDAFISLPARNEGFIPGVANLRLPRFVGERAARQAIFCNRRFQADSFEGRQLCDEIIPKGEMNQALEKALDMLMNSGMVSMASNRRALREGNEPVSVFQSYMATFAWEQANCLFSPALVKNLKEHWVSREK